MSDEPDVGLQGDQRRGGVSDLSDALALISIYSQLLAPQHQREYLIRLLCWASAVLLKYGYSQEWIDQMTRDRKTLRAKWWMLRQFLPDVEILNLVEQLRPLVEERELAEKIEGDRQ